MANCSINYVLSQQFSTYITRSGQVTNAIFICSCLMSSKNEFQEANSILLKYRIEDFNAEIVLS